MAEQRNSALVRKSPLARFWDGEGYASYAVDKVRMQELPFQGVIKLQCRICSEKFLAAVKTVLGFDLPVEPNTRTGNLPACLWAAPNEWVLVTVAGEDAALAERLSQHLSEALAGENFAVTVITDSRVALKIEGESAADLVAKGCSLDLHPEKFAPGQCAVSQLEQVTMLIYPEEASACYMIFLDRSYAAFAWEWLSHAMREFN